MAKKRVHEIAKEKGISSKEVLAVLQAAGLDVKAAASSVDEGEIERAFNAKNGGGYAAVVSVVPPPVSLSSPQPAATMATAITRPRSAPRRHLHTFMGFLLSSHPSGTVCTISVLAFLRRQLAR